jgi:hypothetical protein
MLDSKPDQYVVIEQPVETTIVKDWVDVTSKSKAKKKALNPDNRLHLIRKDRGKPSNKQTSTS